MTDYSGLDLKRGLQHWAEENKIAPADFARELGYSYNHAYQVLRGNYAVVDETLGRIALAPAYGPAAVAKIIEYAGQQ